VTQAQAVFGSFKTTTRRFWRSARTASDACIYFRESQKV
jgi:hypothetical protein